MKNFFPPFFSSRFLIKFNNVKHHCSCIMRVILHQTFISFFRSLVLIFSRNFHFFLMKILGMTIYLQSIVRKSYECFICLFMYTKYFCLWECGKSRIEKFDFFCEIIFQVLSKDFLQKLISSFFQEPSYNWWRLRNIARFCFMDLNFLLMLIFIFRLLYLPSDLFLLQANVC